ADRLFGTADYLSPEQIRNSHIASAESDIYSLGGTFYTMLTGQPPFPAKLVADKLFHQLHTPPPDLRLSRPDVPAELVQLTLRMLAKKPYQRPESARVIADALTAWLRGEKCDPEQFRTGHPSRPYAIEIPRALAVPVAEPIPSENNTRESGVRESDTFPSGKPTLSEDQIVELLTGESVPEETDAQAEPPYHSAEMDGWEEDTIGPIDVGDEGNWPDDLMNAQDEEMEPFVIPDEDPNCDLLPVDPSEDFPDDTVGEEDGVPEIRRSASDEPEEPGENRTLARES
ncbi:MAG: hypothetical protein Q4C47_01050, partial [Planctomycetia bacterium]|nr:hypothetical protein [Planctomycetia bacterium]